MTIDQQCQAARERIAAFINRSAAQHLRAYRERWGEPDMRRELIELRKMLG